MVKLELNVPRELARRILGEQVLVDGTHLVDKAGRISIVERKRSWYSYSISPETAAESVINGTMTTCVDPRKSQKLVRVYGRNTNLMRVYEDPENPNNNSYDYWQCDKRWAKSTMRLIDRDYLNQYPILWSSNDPVKTDTVPDGTEWVYPAGTRFKFHNGILFSTVPRSSSWHKTVVSLALLQQDLKLGLCTRFNPDLSLWTEPVEPAWLKTVRDYIP